MVLRLCQCAKPNPRCWRLKPNSTTAGPARTTRCDVPVTSRDIARLQRVTRDESATSDTADDDSEVPRRRRRPVLSTSPFFTICVRDAQLETRFPSSFGQFSLPGCLRFLRFQPRTTPGSSKCQPLETRQYSLFTESTLPDRFCN